MYLNLGFTLSATRTCWRSLGTRRIFRVCKNISRKCLPASRPSFLTRSRRKFSESPHERGKRWVDSNSTLKKYFCKNVIFFLMFAKIFKVHFPRPVDLTKHVKINDWLEQVGFISVISFFGEKIL